MIGKLIFAVLIFIGSNGANANDNSVGTRELAKTTINQARLATSSGRLDLARAVNAYCKEVQAAYPRNSPSEDRWLDGEISGGGNRVTKALSSAELGRRMASRFTDDCVTSSEWAIKQPDKSIHFVILAHAFIRFSSDSTYYAKLNGLNHEQFWFDGMPRNAAEALAYTAIMIETSEGRP